MKKPILTVKKISSGLYIYFDTYSRKFLDLKVGMKFEGNIEDDEVTLRKVK